MTKEFHAENRGRLGPGRRVCLGRASRSGRGGRLGFFGIGRKAEVGVDDGEGGGGFGE